LLFQPVPTIANSEAMTLSDIGAWLDWPAGRLMLLPVVLVLLAFAIFPSIAL
jgi:hypothetical protein